MNAIRKEYPNGLTVTIREGKGNEPTWEPHGIHYRITLAANGNRRTFDFWGSLHDEQTGTAPDPDDALDCILMDANSGEMDFDEFCADFGYDEDSRRSEALWKQCRDTARRIDGLNLSSEAIGALFDLLQER